MSHIGPSRQSHSLRFVTCLCCLAAACLLSAPNGARGASANRDSLAPLNRFPRMVQEYFVGRLRRFEAANK